MSPSPYRPRFAGKFDKTRCAAGIHGDRTMYWQCTNKPTLEHGGHKWCGIHHPPSWERRTAERERRLKVKRDAQAAHQDKIWAERARQREALRAIRLIAKGHNDPRALADAVLRGEEIGDG